MVYCENFVKKNSDLRLKKSPILSNAGATNEWLNEKMENEPEIAVRISEACNRIINEARNLSNIGAILKTFFINLKMYIFVRKILKSSLMLLRPGSISRIQVKREQKPLHRNRLLMMLTTASRHFIPSFRS